MTARRALRRRRLPDRHLWLRVADGAWEDPLDPTFAAEHGGRWNPPHSFPTLYLNEDLHTAQAQIARLLAGSPVRPEDLDDGSYVLVVAQLPARQVVADVISDEGLEAAGLPTSYPRDARGNEVPWEPCQAVGVMAHDAGLRGVSARSAATADGSGRELAWFPARRTSRAVMVQAPVPFGRWYAARSVADVL